MAEIKNQSDKWMQQLKNSTTWDMTGDERLCTENCANDWNLNGQTEDAYT